MKIIQIIFFFISISYSQSISFFLCEGNFGSSNASLWYLDHNQQLHEAPNNPIGDTAQSMTVYNNLLYVIMNGSNLIHVYTINENEIIFDHTIDLDFFGPRNMLISNNIGYVTEWGSRITIMDLDTESIISTIALNGLPEKIIKDGFYIYVGLYLNNDFSAGNKVLKIDSENHTIVDQFTVAPSPEDMVIIDNILYVSSTTYDQNYTPKYFMSSLDLNNPQEYNQIYEDNSGLAFGSDLVVANGHLYRSISTGITEIDLQSLTVIEESGINNLNNVYSMDFYNGKFYFGISDYTAPDQITIFNEINYQFETYSVGAIPGSFAFWDSNLSSQSDFTKIQFKINKIYPNPFNPLTIFNFNININTNIDISIFDIHGKVIENLYNGNINLGQHQIIWKPSIVSSGVYFVKFKTTQKSITKPIIFQK